MEVSGGGEFKLFDTTSGDVATIQLHFADYHLRQEGGWTGWMRGHVGENDFYALAGAQPVRWFFIPAERQFDALVLCQPGVTIPLSVWASALTYYDGQRTAYAGYATFDPARGTGHPAGGRKHPAARGNRPAAQPSQPRFPMAFLPGPRSRFRPSAHAVG